MFLLFFRNHLGGHYKAGYIFGLVKLNWTNPLLFLILNTFLTTYKSQKI